MSGVSPNAKDCVWGPRARVARSWHRIADSDIRKWAPDHLIAPRLFVPLGVLCTTGGALEKSHSAKLYNKLTYLYNPSIPTEGKKHISLCEACEGRPERVNSYAIET